MKFHFFIAAVGPLIAAQSTFALNLIEAAQAGNITAVETFIMNDLNATSPQYSEALFNAAEQGQLLVVNRLLHSSPADPTAHDNAALKMAAFNNHFDVVSRLLQDSRVYNDTNSTRVQQRQMARQHALDGVRRNATRVAQRLAVREPVPEQPSALNVTRTTQRRQVADTQNPNVVYDQISAEQVMAARNLTRRHHARPHQSVN